MAEKSDIGVSSVLSTFKVTGSLLGIGAIKTWQSSNNIVRNIREFSNNWFLDMKQTFRCGQHRGQGSERLNVLRNNYSTDEILNELICRINPTEPDRADKKINGDDCAKIKNIANSMCDNEYICFTKDDYNQMKKISDTALILCAAWVAFNGIAFDQLKPIITTQFKISEPEWADIERIMHTSRQGANSWVSATTAATVVVPSIAIPFAGIEIFKFATKSTNKRLSSYFSTLNTAYFNLQQEINRLDEAVDSTTREHTRCLNRELETYMGLVYDAQKNNQPSITITYNDEENIIRVANVQTAKQQIRGIIPNFCCLDELRADNAARELRCLEKPEKETRQQEILQLMDTISNQLDSSPHPTIQETFTQLKRLEDVFNNLHLMEIDEAAIKDIREKIAIPVRSSIVDSARTTARATGDAVSFGVNALKTKSYLPSSFSDVQNYFLPKAGGKTRNRRKRKTQKRNRKTRRHR